MNDLGLDSSVLGAIAAGRTRRSQIADAVGRKETALAHPLSVLREARLVDRQADAVRANRPTFHISEPMLRLYQLVVAPNEARLAAARALRSGPSWPIPSKPGSMDRTSRSSPGSGRRTTRPRRLSAPRTGPVGTTVVPCRDHHDQHEVDVVAVERTPGRPPWVLLLGEAKWRRAAVDIAQLDRLRHLRQLVPGADPSTRLALFSRAGFTPALVRHAATVPDVELIDPGRLYRGD